MNDQVHESMRQAANRQRDLADTMAAGSGCDDPHHPWGPQVFTDWHDFTERVCRPLVEADGDEEAVQAAMALYRKQSPFGVCVSLVMALNRIKELEYERNHPYGELAAERPPMAYDPRSAEEIREERP